MAQLVKNTPANAGDTRDVGSIPGSGRSPGEGNSKPFQYSCLENSMDRGAWRATVHEVVKSQTQLSEHACMHACTHRIRGSRAGSRGLPLPLHKAERNLWGRMMDSPTTQDPCPQDSFHFLPIQFALKRSPAKDPQCQEDAVHQGNRFILTTEPGQLTFD